MLKKEQAQADLEKLQNKNWATTRIGAASSLPDELRDTARSILKLQDESFHPALAQGLKRVRDVAKAFVAMDECARLQCFEAIAPGLGKYIERGWHLFECLPYESGFERKPFRAPGHPETLIYRRLNWFAQLIPVIGPYQKDITWFAAWAPHLATYWGADVLGILLAAAIDEGGSEGEEVFQILCASGRNEHEIGGMGRHVIRGLLTASREDGWQFVENMLLAAQREEGLRQSILETIDEGHPEAFRRMLKLIIDHKLARFSSTVRAFDVWLGYRWDGASIGVVNSGIEKLLLCLEDKSARDAALKSKDAEHVFLALWSCAFDDVSSAVKPATELLRHPNAEHRFAAVHLLDQLKVSAAIEPLRSALEDSGLSVATRAFIAFQRHAWEEDLKEIDLFERFEKLVARYPQKPEKLRPAIWPWTNYTISKEFAANGLVTKLGDRPPTRLLPYLQHMGTTQRAAVVYMLAKQAKWDVATRDTLFELLGDSSRGVREAALDCLKKCQITPDEAADIEKLLDRKSGDLRRGALLMLAQQSEECALASADRLMNANSQTKRLAGLELLRQLAESKRGVEKARIFAEQYLSKHPKLNDTERLHIEAVLNLGHEAPTLDNALGLLDHEKRTWPSPPVAHDVLFHSTTAPRIVASVEAFLKANAQEVFSVTWSNGTEVKGLLDEFTYPQSDPKKSAEDHRKYMPLADAIEKWWLARGQELRDADGMELLRTLAWIEFGENYDRGQRLLRGSGEETATLDKAAIQIIFGGQTPKKEKSDDLILSSYRRAASVKAILTWLLRLHPPAKAAEFALSAAESSLARVPKSMLQYSDAEAVEFAEPDDTNIFRDWQKTHARNAKRAAKTSWRKSESPYGVWLKIVGDLCHWVPEFWASALHARHWNLLRWIDQPVRPLEHGGHSGVKLSHCVPRERCGIIEVALAYSAGAATEADIIDHVLARHAYAHYFSRHNLSALGDLTRRKPAALYSKFEFLFPLANRCRERVLEVELTRGDTPTAASEPALNISFVEGISNLVAILRTLGKRKFIRGYSRDNASVETVMSHLVRCCFPAANETSEDFRKKVKAAAIGENRLVELALYAPQWAAFVEHALGWPSLTEAVWWIHAHTKGEDWTVDREIREIWDADMSVRTSLSPSDLIDGAVDVAWFNRIYKTLGAKRWNAIYEAARFASTGAGHARARLFADAMLDNVSKKELIERITKKRYQDAVRALGLLPLAEGAKREGDVLNRYKVIQEFRRGSKQFGSQRQASEKRAANIAMQNLARTAGYPDPIRLEWAMEAKAVEDLGDGPIEVVVDGVKVSLGIDAWGEVEWSITKDGKTLADIPAKLKKNPKIVALRERKVELKRQASRIRPSLEQFMVRDDEFSGSELRELMEHPLLAPMLKNLVVIGEGIKGFPVHDGKALENARGEVEAIKAKEKLRIAHPLDLLPAVEWHCWQKDCFARERIQPFKQVFRELYSLTETEKKESTQTTRYAGHQVQPRQALAMLGQRGWVHHPEEGVRKVFHDAGLVAWLSFEEGFSTPAEIEGLTLEGVFFTKRDDDKRVKLTELPPRLFSEAMRDLDLVVSVAHRGGVDPEASASTVEMRATLVEQTAQLLKLKNVRIKDRYALIKGQLGEYSIHLGSAVTRKMPGEMLFIIPVHSQHRGRLFLPFADDDPRTAEVMSKVLLLARDHEIKDPNILDQIR